MLVSRRLVKWHYQARLVSTISYKKNIHVVGLQTWRHEDSWRHAEMGPQFLSLSLPSRRCFSASRGEKDSSGATESKSSDEKNFSAANDDPKKPLAEQLLDRTLKGKTHEDFDPWKLKTDEDSGKLYWYNTKTGEKHFGAQKPVSKHMAMAQNLGYGALTAVLGVFFVKVMWYDNAKKER